MKNAKYFFFILCTIILSCTSDNSAPSTTAPPAGFEISDITPLSGKIGDTITVSGTNLNKLKEIIFLHEDKTYFNDTITVNAYTFITKTNEEVTLKIPGLFHEKIIIDFPDLIDFKLDLVGFIPVLDDFDHAYQIQTIDENTAFLRDGEKIYKSTNGYYQWTPLIEFDDKNITSFFFLDEDHGWVGVMEGTGRNIYYTEDGGNNLSLKYHINDTPGAVLDGSHITKIQFVSPDNGLFKDGNQNIYVAENDSWENVYSYYPDLSTLPFGEIELWDFNAINEDLIFLTGNNGPYLIKIDNQTISHHEFSNYPSEAPHLFNDTGFMQVNSSIYKTTDSGSTWNEITTFEGYFPEIYFFDEQEGFAFVNYSPSEIYVTNDGGISWKNYFSFPQYHDAHSKDFAGTTGLMGSYNGKLWKYIKE